MIARRALLAMMACGAFTPATVRAQQPGKPRRIGFLVVRARSTPANPEPYYDAFVRAMAESGYVEGKNLAIEWRAAHSDYSKLPALAAELVQANVEVIVTHSTPAAQALRKATSSVPVVFIAVSDPVAAGVVKSLSHPGGNMTGVSNIQIDLSTKYLELLMAFVPKLQHVRVLVNPNNAALPGIFESIDAAAKAKRISAVRVDARSTDEIERAFSGMQRENTRAMIVPVDSYYIQQRRQIAALAQKYRVLTVFGTGEEVEAGGLLSYGVDVSKHFARAAFYVDKILKGVKPAEIPVEQPMRFDLVLNMKTANALGLKVPPDVMIQTTRVIEK